VFVYVLFEYSSKKNPLNQVVVWDRIIQRKEDAVIDEQAFRAEYVMADQGYHLKGAEVVLRVGWDITPIGGPLIRGMNNGTRIKFPTEYIE
jgi:signal peptidase complex subunit 3